MAKLRRDEIAPTTTLDGEHSKKRNVAKQANFVRARCSLPQVLRKKTKETQEQVYSAGDMLSRHFDRQ